MMSSRVAVLLVLWSAGVASAEPLPGTKPLDWEGDIAAKMVAGIGKYLERELDGVPKLREQPWNPDFTSPAAYRKSVEPNRQRLRKILGIVDERVPFTDIEYVSGPNTPARVAETNDYKVFAVRWPVLPGVDAEGLLLEPKGQMLAQVVAIPDADQTPEQIVGLSDGVHRRSQFARFLAEKGCRVLIPTLIDRQDTFSGNAKLNRWTNQPHREFVYRAAYEMGRHPLGYEVQKVLAAVDWFKREKDALGIGVIGYGEGGMIAFYAGAVDERIEACTSSGWNFRQNQPLWEQPIYRNVFGLLPEFDSACAVCLYAPERSIVFNRTRPPTVNGPPAPREARKGAAPGAITIPTAKREFSTGPGTFIPGLEIGLGFPGGNGTYNSQKVDRVSFMHSASSVDSGIPTTEFAVDQLLLHLCERGFKQNGGPPPEGGVSPIHLRKSFDPTVRQKRQFDQLVAHTQKLWRDSDSVRRDFWKKADASTPEKWQTSCQWYRDYFHKEVIGALPITQLPPSPRSRSVYDTPKWTGHEVVLDAHHHDVFAYGILLLPKDLKPGEKRPVVVCQHGLEGRPQDVCNPKERTKYYNSFGAQLADRGYIVFAPQNPYIGKDDFRVLQRMANPLKLSLFSFIIRQHEVTLDWLATHPNVDADKIAFYGLSYGGKTAMRVPAVLPRYCLSICSGDFNEWIGKNVSVDLPQSYMFTHEYEMPEFDLGSTFNYAEMAYLIAPRPFMVERGHDDGVGTDEMVASEYAKVRYLYANKLKIPERTEIEFFAGGHEIHGKGTFEFLKRHLGWPKPAN